MLVYIYIDGKPYSADLDKYNKEYVTFGSGPDCDIKLNKRYISAHHGFFAKKNGEWFIKDYNSENGIYLHSNKIDVLKMKDCSVKIYGRDNPKDMIRIISENQMNILKQHQKQDVQVNRSSKPAHSLERNRQEKSVEYGNHLGGYRSQEYQSVGYGSQGVQSEGYSSQDGQLGGYESNLASNGAHVKKNVLGKIFKLGIIIMSLAVIVGCFLPFLKFESSKLYEELGLEDSGFDAILGDYVDSAKEKLDEELNEKQEPIIKGENRGVAIVIIVVAIITASLAAKNDLLILNILDIIVALVNPVISIIWMVELNNLKTDEEVSKSMQVAAKMATFDIGFWLIMIGSFVTLALAIATLVLTIIKNKKN